MASRIMCPRRGSNKASNGAKCQRTQEPLASLGDPDTSARLWHVPPMGPSLGPAAPRFMVPLRPAGSLPAEVRRPPTCLRLDSQARSHLVASRPIAHCIERFHLLPECIRRRPCPEPPRLLVVRIPGHAYGHAGFRCPGLAMRGGEPRSPHGDGARSSGVQPRIPRAA